MHENLARRMIEGVGMHGFHDGDVIGHFGQVWQQFGKLRAGLAVFCKGEFRAKQCGIWVDERGAVAFQQFSRRKRAIEFCQLRFVIEQLQMARCASHEKVDHVLCFGWEMWLLRRERVGLAGLGGGGGLCVTTQEAMQRDGS